ncbi:exonuclease SbcCD subunit D [Fictibacillus iocasae]|uniref:Exonuclease SbcCD subunit D n=1 Tax=Fictibacillus iocasae TaxID=2715437 RepID=A0ABW2NUE1_9BACL
MVTFVHCADLHLDSPFKGLGSLPASIFQRLQESTFAAFSKLVDIAIAEETDFMLVAGDIFDGDMRSLKAQYRFKKEMEKLNRSNIKVYISHGNHDHLGGQWTELDWPENVTFFSGKDVEKAVFKKNGRTEAVIYGFSYETRAVTENRTNQYPVKTGDVLHIGMLHGQAAGYTGHDPYAPFLLQELISKNYDYWALGHIHKRSDLSIDPPIRYSGNIQGRHKNETGEKGAYIVELDKDGESSRFISTSDIIWKEESLQMENIESENDLLNTCLKIKETCREDSKGVLLKLVLTGKSPIFLSLSSFLSELHDVLNEEESEGDFVFVHEIANESWPDRSMTNVQTGFWADVQQMMEKNDVMNESLIELYGHRQAAKFLDQLSEDDVKEVMRLAQNELLMERLKN